jgi:hypothetical protein
VNDSWSSESAGSTSSPVEAPTAAPPRRGDRYQGPRADERPARRERYPWVGLAFLFAGLVAGGIGLAMIAKELDRPGVPEVASERWWLVVGGGLAIAWSAPWFLRPRGRRNMAIVVGVCTAAVLVAAAVAIGGLGD